MIDLQLTLIDRPLLFQPWYKWFRLPDAGLFVCVKPLTVIHDEQCPLTTILCGPLTTPLPSSRRVLPQFTFISNYLMTRFATVSTVTNLLVLKTVASSPPSPGGTLEIISDMLFEVRNSTFSPQCTYLVITF
jgi:hypothetical protein